MRPWPDTDGGGRKRRWLLGAALVGLVTVVVAVAFVGLVRFGVLPPHDFVEVAVTPHDAEAVYERPQWRVLQGVVLAPRDLRDSELAADDVEGTVTHAGWESAVRMGDGRTSAASG